MGWGRRAYLQIRRGRKFLVVEKVVKLLLCFHLEGFGVFGIGAEDGNEVFVMPFLDVVVRCRHAVDHALNGVATVADKEASIKGMIN